MDRSKQKTIFDIDHEYKIFISQKAINYGLLTGVLMGALVAVLHLITIDIPTAVKFIKYIVPAVTLGLFIHEIKKYIPEDDTFKDGLQFGAITAALSAITLIVFNLFVTIIGGANFADEYTQNANSIEKLLVVEGIIFFEVFALCLVINFIWLLLIKDETPDLEM